jgi:hypothetical protein
MLREAAATCLRRIRRMGMQKLGVELLRPTLELQPNVLELLSQEVPDADLGPSDISGVGAAGRPDFIELVRSPFPGERAEPLVEEDAESLAPVQAGACWAGERAHEHSSKMLRACSSQRQHCLPPSTIMACRERCPTVGCLLSPSTWIVSRGRSRPSTRCLCSRQSRQPWCQKGPVPVARSSPAHVPRLTDEMLGPDPIPLAGSGEEDQGGPGDQGAPPHARPPVSGPGASVRGFWGGGAQMVLLACDAWGPGRGLADGASHTSLLPWDAAPSCRSGRG